MEINSRKGETRIEKTRKKIFNIRKGRDGRETVEAERQRGEGVRAFRRPRSGTDSHSRATAGATKMGSAVEGNRKCRGHCTGGGVELKRGVKGIWSSMIVPQVATRIEKKLWTLHEKNIFRKCMISGKCASRKSLNDVNCGMRHAQ